MEGGGVDYAILPSGLQGRIQAHTHACQTTMLTETAISENAHALWREHDFKQQMWVSRNLPKVTQDMFQAHSLFFLQAPARCSSLLLWVCWGAVIQVYRLERAIAFPAPWILQSKLAV